MTGMLQDLLHDRAEDLGAPHVDLATITRDGERRVRRRRTALLGGLAAATVAAGLAVPTLIPSDQPGSTDEIVAGGTAPVPLSWVTGSTLHRAGQPDVDLGAEVRAWVWVGGDIVLTDADLNVRLWTGDGLDVIGKVANPPSDDAELVVDGSAVSWIDVERGLVRMDLATGRSDALPLDLPYSSRATAMSGSMVYAVDERGVFSWDADTGDVEVLDPTGRDVVIDTEGGTSLFAGRGRDARVSGPYGTMRVTVDSYADLSPSGARLVAESDDTGVLIDIATGERIPLDTGHAWSLPFQWLGEDTVTVLAFDGIGTEGTQDDVAFLLPCTISTGACDAGVQLPAEFQLPIGIHLDT